MSNFVELARAIRAKVERDKLLPQLADALDAIGSIEQASGEAQARLTKLRADEAQATLDLAALRVTTEGIKQATMDMQAAVQREADSITAQAKAEAEKILADAQRNALTLEDDARAYVQEQRIFGDSLRANLAALEADIADKTAKRDALTAEVEALLAKFK